MKIAVVGSRDYLALDIVKYVVGGFPTDTVVVLASTRDIKEGVTHAAAEAAHEFLVPEPLRISADDAPKSSDWQARNKWRNRQIVKVCDYLIAFWDMESTGIKQTIDYAMKLERPLGVFGPDGKLAIIADKEDLDLPAPKPEIRTPGKDVT